MTDTTKQPEASLPERSWTAGPWQWYGETKNGEPYLATKHSGRIFVLDVDAEITSCTNCDEWDDDSHTRNPRCECATARGVLRLQTDQLMHNAHEYAQYEVIGGQTADPADERLYRHDYKGFDHPDAQLIALAPEMAEAILAAVDEGANYDGGDGTAAVIEMADKLRAIGGAA